MSMVNPKHIMQAAEFDYTYMGKSASEISAIYNLPIPVINAEVNSGRWERKLEPACLPDTQDLEKFAETLKTMTEQRLTVISLFRQIDNQPLYAQIEKALLSKILTLVEAVNVADDKSAIKIANLTKALVSIQERNPVQLSEQIGDGKGKGSVNVYIQNNLSGQQEEKTIEVKQVQ